MNIDRLERARKELIDSIDWLRAELLKVYNTYPGLFAKPPEQMSTADCIRFSGDLIEFIKVRDQYGKDADV
jgi:hypothetical protein